MMFPLFFLLYNLQCLLIQAWSLTFSLDSTIFYNSPCFVFTPVIILSEELKKILKGKFVACELIKAGALHFLKNFAFFHQELTTILSLQVLS